MPYVLWQRSVVTPGYSNYLVDVAPLPQRLAGNGHQWGWPSISLSPPGPRHTAATNLIQEVDTTQGDQWAIIPRLREGVCYITKLMNSYQIWPSTAPWVMALTSSLQGHGLSLQQQYAILADAAQGWDTTPWQKVSLTALPRWFWIQTNSRGSFNRVHARAGFKSPQDIASNAYATPHVSPIAPPASIPGTVQTRLAEKLSPSALEFLCVELLNLAAHGGCALWMHIGGVGDDGLDGVGFDAAGHACHFLSVKWQIDPSTNMCGPGPAGTSPLVVAYLLGNPPPPRPNWTIWGPGHIAKLIWHHKSDLSRSFQRLLGV